MKKNLLAFFLFTLDHYWILWDAAIFGAAFATAMAIGRALPYDNSYSRVLLLMLPIAFAFGLVLCIHAYVNRRK